MRGWTAGCCGRSRCWPEPEGGSLLTVRGLSEFPPGDSVLALGTFDGLHLGHQQVIRHAVAHAHGSGTRSVAVTFEPHPLEVLRPGTDPVLLSTLDERVALLSNLRVDGARLAGRRARGAAGGPGDLRRLLVHVWIPAGGHRAGPRRVGPGARDRGAPRPGRAGRRRAGQQQPDPERAPGRVGG
ncbi:MAG: hypothetical protein E6H04_11815 [Bacillati bacterium ANGP1]|uniref:FAD synthase n=1 Tax=Candidatus Segetimicrobium genomatis TaxID=2569760 RepID=A0A537J5Y7_9BACT|nr:MAG: hypothetical protein E6H04_11815 [Terrabacteria group bacterium ANGP1]